MDEKGNTAVLEWEYEFADALAAVIKSAIDSGADAARDALTAFEKIEIRGYTINLQDQIREARALALQVAV